MSNINNRDHMLMPDKKPYLKEANNMMKKATRKMTNHHLLRQINFLSHVHNRKNTMNNNNRIMNKNINSRNQRSSKHRKINKIH